MERMNKIPARVVIGEDEKGSVELQVGEEWIPATDVLPLSSALSESSGVALIGASSAHYITDTQPDLAYLLSQVIESLNSVVDICSANYAVPMEAGVAPNPDLQPIKGELQTLIQELQEYKLR